MILWTFPADLLEIAQGFNDESLVALVFYLLLGLWLNARFGKPAFEPVAVALIAFFGALLVQRQFHPEPDTTGGLLSGLITLVGVPIFWTEFRARSRDSRAKMFWDAHQAYIADRDLTLTGLEIECFNYLIDGKENRIRTLLNREEQTRIRRADGVHDGRDYSRTAEELELNRRIDTYLTYLNDMCKMKEYRWIGRREFEQGCWAFYAGAVMDSEKGSLRSYVTQPDYGWNALVAEGERHIRREQRRDEMNKQTTRSRRVRTWLRQRGVGDPRRWSGRGLPETQSHAD